MQYMDLVIINGAFNDRYDNNSTCIYFGIQYNVINVLIEVSDCWKRGGGGCIISVIWFHLAFMIVLLRIS